MSALKFWPFLGLLFFCISNPVQSQVDTLEIRQPTEHVTYVSLVDSTQPWRIHLLDINLQDSPLNLRTRKAPPDGNLNMPDRKTLPAMWNQLEADSLRPVAGINGDFFNMETGDPINIQIADEKPIYIPLNKPNRSQFGFTNDGTPFIDLLNFSGSVSVDGHRSDLTAVNTLPQKNGLTLINTLLDSLPVQADSLLFAPLQSTSGNGSSVNSQFIFDDKTNTAPPMLIASGKMRDSLQILKTAGDTLRIQYQFSSETRDKPIAELIGGAVQLIENGRQVIDRQLDIEGVSSSFATDRHPRTAVGISPDGHLWMMVVDGRQEISTGMSLYELAEFMSEFGITEALNLDGGGSTTMMVDGKVVNSPSDATGLRPISNALFLIADPTQ